MKIRPYSEEFSAGWDALVQASYFATFLHSRRFLTYHGNRFVDRSLMIYDEQERLIGVFPAALTTNDNSIVVSHPGSSYGGLIHAGRLRGDRALLAMEGIVNHYRESSISRLRYKAVPHMFHRSPAQDDLYALFRMGATRYRADLSCAIDLQSRLPVSDRRKRALKVACKAGVEVYSGTEFSAQIWRVLTNNLESKHGVRPVHTLDEIMILQERFPNAIEFVAAIHKEEVVAGVVLFHSARVVHAQYIASSDIGYECQALDALLEWAISRAQQQGTTRYFDFGVSNEDEGKTLNRGLYDFKSEFGGGGVIHEFFELNLS